ncbi:MAG: hypothetical protein ACE5HE_05905 [Phycisphaerae bacterium]
MLNCMQRGKLGVTFFAAFAFVFPLPGCGGGGRGGGGGFGANGGDVGNGGDEAPPDSDTVSPEDLVPVFLPDEAVAEKSVAVTPEDGGEVTVAGATLTIPPGALVEDAQLGLVAVNVTAESLPPGDGALLGQKVISTQGYLITSDKALDLSSPLTLRIPLDTAGIPADTSPDSVHIATQVGGYVVLQGDADVVDLDQGFVELTLEIPELQAGTASQTIQQSPRPFGASFLLVAGALAIGGPLTINPIIATMDDVNLLRYEFWAGTNFAFHYNPAVFPALGDVLDLEETLDRAHALFVDEMGFSLPNLVNLDGRYTIVIDDLSEHSLLPTDPNGAVADGITLPGSSLFEGASYLSALLGREQLETVAVHEYFHALQFGALTSPFIVNLGDTKLNAQSQWLFEGSATALSGRVVFGDSTSPARDRGLSNPLRAQTSLFDENQDPAPDVAQDFFYFLERRLQGTSFYLPIFEALGPNLLDDRERAVRAADEVLTGLTGGGMGMAQAWEDFVIDFWLDNRALYPAANLSESLVLDGTAERSTTFTLPSLSYAAIQVAVPPLEEDADGAALPDQAVDLELEVSMTTASGLPDALGIELADALASDASLRESWMATTSGVRSRKLPDFRTDARRNLFVIMSYPNVAAGAEASMSLTARLVKPEQDFPRTYVATGTRTLSVEGEFPGESAVKTQRIDVSITLYENGDVTGAITSPDGEAVEVAVIGGEPGETAIVIQNTLPVEITCPSDAANNAGETVKVVQFSFGSVRWEGNWSEDGSYDMKFRSSYFDMTISGSFSDDSISGGLAWPDAQEFPMGFESSNFICSRYESTVFSRIEWEFTGQRSTDTGN